jgi:hypothetical protein
LTCGTAYRHCTEEKHFIVVCASLGLNLAQREFQPVYADGHRISYDDVVRAMGLVKNTLSNTRTQLQGFEFHQMQEIQARTSKETPKNTVYAT